MVESNEGIEINQETQKKSIELASLVWLYFSKSNYRELLEDDFKSLKKLKKWFEWLVAWTKEEVTVLLEWKERIFTIQEKSELEQIIEAKEKKYIESRKKIEIWANKFSDEYIPSILWNDGDEVWELDFDALLSWDFNVNDTLSRIRELYSEPWVKELYNEELNGRKAGFELLEDWEKELKEVSLVEAKIEKAKKIILDIKRESFLEWKKLKTDKNNFIKNIRKLINKEELKLVDLLNNRETATSYRFNTLKKYKKELDNTWFVNVPSRKTIVDEWIETLLLWENLSLSWPTWTGKTKLAKKINSVLFNDDNSIVLSWHSWITAWEFIAKPSLVSDWKGWMYTDTQLWKLLKAFVNWKIPIIDEIDLIPNDVLMRVKDLFTKPKIYSPQEDWDTEYKLKSNTIIATKNIKSEKHPDREKTDWAIVRHFEWVQVPYLKEEEAYDIALCSLMEPEWYIENISLEELQEGWVLFNLIKSLKDIEESYLWKGGGLKVTISESDKSWLFLQEAILETWKFVGIFEWFKDSNMSFKEFIKSKIIKFISIWDYPLSDKLLLIKIFSNRWILLKKDINLLTNKIKDVSEDNIKWSLMSEYDIFSDEWTKFIDPYELANLDPYNIRKLSQLELWDEQKRLKSFMESMSQKAIENMGDENWDELWSIVDNVLSKIEENPDFEIEETEIENICNKLWKTKDAEMVHKLPMIWKKWEEGFKQILEDDTEGELENTTTTATDVSNDTNVVSENMNLTEFITSRRQSFLDEYKNNWTINANWSDFPVNLNDSDKREVEQLDSNDISISSERTITINSENITVSEVLINWTEFMAIQVPNFLKWKRLKETYIWEQLAENSNLPDSFLNETIDLPYIIYGKTNVKDSSWNNKVNISSYNPSADTDAVRESLKKWFNTTNIVYETILWELIKEHEDLWENYLNYIWYKADKDWHEEKIRHLDKIEEVFGMVFNNYADNGYVIRDYWVYKNKDWDTRGFRRGGYAYDGAVGGAVSLTLNCYADVSSDYISFRPSV